MIMPLNEKKSSRLPLISAIALMTMLTPVVLAEIIVRLFSPEGYITPEILRQQYVQYAPAVFARNVLPQHSQTIRQRGTVISEINALGYRGNPFQANKPKNIIRIMIYGGSSVYDLGAKLNQDWPSQVQTLLRKKGLPNVEVINAGIPGHASFDCLGRLYAEGHLFSPDFVVLYAGWNDLKTWEDNKSILRKIKPYQPEKDPLYTYQNFLDRFLCNASQLYVRLRYRWILWKYNAGLEGKKIRAKSHSIDPAGPRQFRLTAKTFIDLANNIGAVPVLMTEAHLIEPNNTDAEKKIIQYDFQSLTPEKLLQATLEAEDILKQTAQNKNAVLIDASATMSGQTGYFQDHIHLSAEGSKKIAVITADALYALLEKKGL